MTSLVLSCPRAIRFATLAACAAGALGLLGSPAPAATRHAKPAPKSAAKRRRPSRPWSRPSATGACSSAKSARDASAIRLRSRNRASPRASPAIRAMRSSPTVRRRGCATRCRSSWASTSPRATRPIRRPTPSRAKSRRGQTSDREHPSRRPRSPWSTRTSFEMLPKGADLWVKNAAKEGALIAEMRKGAKLDDQGRFAPGPPVGRHLFADRFLAGDGAAAEGMSGEVRLGLRPVQRRPWRRSPRFGFS